MLSNLKIPKELRRKIDNELQQGEFIRWVEQPVPRFFTDASINTVLSGIPVTSFAIAWMLGVLSILKGTTQPQAHVIVIPFALFGLPFVLGGFQMLSSPIWVWQEARNTVYLVTDKRAISIQGGSSTIIRSYLPDQLKDVYRKERADGTGDVIIAIRRWKDSEGHERAEEIGFLGVRSSQEVANMLRQFVQNNAYELSESMFDSEGKI
jgi:hypothetical protein